MNVKAVHIHWIDNSRLDWAALESDTIKNIYVQRGERFWEITWKHEDSLGIKVVNFDAVQSIDLVR